MRKKKSNPHQKPAEKESHCLNCGEPLMGNFCHHCGQKAFFHKDHFFHLVFEFVADYFHFDGKFFSTLKVLIVKPGQLTKEYMAGRRKTYLNPIQMYIFVSAVFFLLFTGVVKNLTEEDHPAPLANSQKLYDSIRVQRAQVAQSSIYESESGFSLNDLGFCINNKVFTIREYDSIENNLPANKKEKGLLRNLHRKLLSINERFLDPSIIADELMPEAFLHNLPKAFFLLLPVFAFLLWLCFPRVAYVDHIIFSIHFHIVGFILLGICLVITAWIMSASVSLVYLIALLLFAIYLFLSLRRVFQKNYFKTTYKFIFLATTYGFFFTFVMILLMVITAFSL